MRKIRKILCVILTIVGILFGVLGFVVPPLGIIDSSVLWLIAQFLIYSASILGIDLRHSTEVYQVDKSNKNNTL